MKAKPQPPGTQLGKVEARIDASLEAIVGARDPEMISTLKLGIMRDIQTLYHRGFRELGDLYIQKYGAALEKLEYKRK